MTKANDSFWEVYGKATYTFNDQWAAGIQEWYSPSVVNTGAWGWYTVGNVTFTAPSNWFQNGLGMYISGDLGYWDLGTSDAFYGVTKYTSYANWDAGVGFTWKVLTLDLRYYDTNLNKSECNAFTSAQNATFSPGNITAAKPERPWDQLVRRLVHRQALGLDRLQLEPQVKSGQVSNRCRAEAVALPPDLFCDVAPRFF